MRRRQPSEWRSASIEKPGAGVGHVEYGLSLLRVTVVQAKNLIIPDNQPCRPFVSVRVGTQYGNTKLAGGFKWSGQQEVTCEWMQTFDLVVRQVPTEEDLGDLLALRVMSYQMARKDTCLGKVDIAVATLGDPLRPPETGVLLRGRDGPGMSSTRRGNNLSRRMAQDFWVPLTTTNTTSMQSIHAGELRLRLLIQPVPPFHQYYKHFPHPSVLRANPASFGIFQGGSDGRDPSEGYHNRQHHKQKGTSGTGQEHLSVATLPVEAREETDEDRALILGLLRRFLRSVRHSSHVASPKSASFLLSEHRSATEQSKLSNTDTISSIRCSLSSSSSQLPSTPSGSGSGSGSPPPPPLLPPLPPPAHPGNPPPKQSGTEEQSQQQQSKQRRRRRRRLERQRRRGHPGQGDKSTPNLAEESLVLQVERRFGWEITASASATIGDSLPSSPHAHPLSPKGLLSPPPSVAADISVSAGVLPVPSTVAGHESDGSVHNQDWGNTSTHTEDISSTLNTSSTNVTSKEPKINSREHHAPLPAAPFDDSEVLNAVLEQMQREQHQRLRESTTAPLWLHAVSRAMQNPLPFGAWTSSSSASSSLSPPAATRHSPNASPSNLLPSKKRGHSNWNTTDSFSGNRTTGSRPLQVGTGRAESPAAVAEMRALMLSGVPDSLRIGGFPISAFHGLPLSWLPQTRQQRALAERRYYKRRHRQLREGESSGRDDLRTEAISVVDSASDATVDIPESRSRALAGERWHYHSHDPSLRRGIDAFPASTVPPERIKDEIGSPGQPVTGNTSRSPLIKGAVLSRLRVSVPRFHMVHDSSVSSFALYRIRVCVDEAPLDAAHNFVTPIKKTKEAEDCKAAPGRRSAGSNSVGTRKICATWDVLRRFSEFEALVGFLTDASTGSLVGNNAAERLKDLGLASGVLSKSVRSLLRVTMTPDFLAERRAKLEVALRTLLEATKVPDAVCGYPNSRLSDLGQAALLSFLGAPEALHPSIPPALQLAYLIRDCIKQLIPENDTDAIAWATSLQQQGRHQGNDSVDEVVGNQEKDTPLPSPLARLSSSLDVHVASSPRIPDAPGSLGNRILMSDPSSIETRKDTLTSGLRPFPAPPTRVLHFRSFMWLLVSGSARRLATGRIFNGVPYSYERLAAVSRESDWIALVTKVREEHTMQQRLQERSTSSTNENFAKPLRVVDESRASLAAFRQVRTNASDCSSGATIDSSSGRATFHSLRGNQVARSYRLLAASFAQIRLDVMRTKVKPLHPSAMSIIDTLTVPTTQIDAKSMDIGKPGSEENVNIENGESDIEDDFDSNEDYSEDGSDAGHYYDDSDDDDDEDDDSDPNIARYEYYDSVFDEEDDDLFEEELLDKATVRNGGGTFSMLGKLCSFYGNGGGDIIDNVHDIDGAVKDVSTDSGVMKDQDNAHASEGNGGALARMYVTLVPGDEAAALKRILRAFVLSRPHVGYCQAMNYVALFLLRATGCTDVRPAGASRKHRSALGGSRTAVILSQLWRRHLRRQGHAKELTSAANDKNGTPTEKLPGRRFMRMLSYRFQHVRRWLEAERLAFVLLITLSEDIVPDYWSPSMLAIQADMKLLNLMVKSSLPKLSRHLEDIRLPLDLFATQWLVSLFTASLPPPTVARVWDWLFLDGPPVLLCVSLALLRRAEPALRDTDDLSTCAELLNGEAQAAVDPDALVADARKEMRECEMAGLHLRALRHQHTMEVRKEIEKKEHTKRLKRRSVGQLVRLTEGTVDRFFSTVESPPGTVRTAASRHVASMQSASPSSLNQSSAPRSTNEGGVDNGRLTQGRNERHSESQSLGVEALNAFEIPSSNMSNEAEGSRTTESNRTLISDRIPTVPGVSPSPNRRRRSLSEDSIMAVKASMAPMNYDINGDEEDDDDNLLYEERWTVISRNDCLRESLVANVDEDYWESRRSNTGIASDKGDNFDSDDVFSSNKVNALSNLAVSQGAVDVGELISPSMVHGKRRAPSNHLSALTLVDLVERLHGDFLQLVQKTIRKERAKAEEKRERKVLENAEKARRKAAMADAVIGLRYSPHSRRSQAVDAERQQQMSDPILHAATSVLSSSSLPVEHVPEFASDQTYLSNPQNLAAKSGRSSASNEVPVQLPSSSPPLLQAPAIAASLAFRVHSDSFRLTEKQFRSIMRPALTYCQIRATTYGSYEGIDNPYLDQKLTMSSDADRYGNQKRKSRILPKRKSGKAVASSISSSMRPPSGELIEEHFDNIMSDIFKRFCDVNRRLDWQEFLHCWAILSGTSPINNQEHQMQSHKDTAESSQEGIDNMNNTEVEDKVRLCFTVCDRANIKSIDRTELAALLHYAYELLSASSSGGISDVGVGEHSFSQAGSNERFGGSNAIYPLDDVITPDTVSNILDICFPPSNGSATSSTSDHNDGGNNDNKPGASRLTLDGFLDIVRQNPGIADFLLLGRRRGARRA